MPGQLSRRALLTTSAAALGAVAIDVPNSLIAAPAPARSKDEPFGYCLNTSTIRGQQLSIVEVVEIAAKAGFGSIEPWIREIDAYVKSGGSLRDLGKRIADLGLTVESAIGFAQWIVDDDERRKKGFEEAKRDMEMVRAIGGKRVAAPPVGATDQQDLDLRKAAQRYRELCELGEKFEVAPEVELWGFSRTLNRLGDVAYVAIESGHPQACILADVYHMYKGGGDHGGLRLLSGSSMHVMHVNDYPATPDRATIKDANRVYPGDGVAPLGEVFRTLRDIGYRGVLSVELFNADYWKQDALKVATTAFERTRAAVQKALA